jgi:hypothetical protein
VANYRLERRDKTGTRRVAMTAFRSGEEPDPFGMEAAIERERLVGLAPRTS